MGEMMLRIVSVVVEAKVVTVFSPIPESFNRN
jgi:hypothetical protein